VTTTSTYALRLSDDERARYRLMAEMAAAEEDDDWTAAGVTPGARVADVGCGPGAILAVLADRVGPDGAALGVDRDPEAVRDAREAIAGYPHAAAHTGDAHLSGLPVGVFDVAMCRHVLAHNGGREAAIVGHLAALVRPGGAVYLVDVDLSAAGLFPPPPGLDIDDHYRTFHARRGADLRIGLRLGTLLEDAGLVVERYRSLAKVMRLPAGMRGPQWAAREAMVAERVATAADVARWDAAYDRLDGADRRPWAFISVFVAVGRRPPRDF
jgi:SAM-dependent methyltransferase